MKKCKKLLPVIAVAAMLAILLASSSVVSYLVDKDEATNVIHIGKVDLSVSEPSYQESQTIVPGSKLPKNPVVTNTGSLPEYVFLAVTVPKRNVTLLNEKWETGTEGAKKTGMPANVELFRTFATNNNATPTDISDYSTIDYTNIKIGYNKVSTDGSTEGWYYLESTIGSGSDPDVHYFGYNKALAQNASTIPLFDYIQLKSFIEGEVSYTDTSAMNVDIRAYGIQSDNINLSGTTPNPYLTSAQVNQVFAIVENKGLGASYQ